MPVRKTVLVLLVLCWCLFVAVQKGDPFDETEHAHVGWLMGQLHQRPLRDFFQHHQPLLWDVLQLYYRLGGTGPEVRYFGRAVVVACAVLCCAGVVLLARRAAPGEGRGAVLGILPLIGLSLLFPSFFVVRPETLGLACFLLAVVAWLPGRAVRRWPWDLLAGAAFGLALLASPRFLLLAPTFVILPKDPRKLVFRRPGPLALLLLGTVAVASLYLLLRGYSLEELRFDLAFSSALARVGPGYFREAPLLLLATAGGAGVLSWVHAQLPRPARRRFLLHVVYLGLVLAATLFSTWPYLYPQNLFAPAAWLAVLLATADGQVDWQPPSRRAFLGAATWAAVAGCLLLTGGNVLLGTTVADRVAQDRALLEGLRPGDRVLLASGMHPICVADASYYANPITDAEDRLGATVRRVRPRWPLPECDYLRDIREQRPALIDGLVLGVLPGEQGAAVEELLRDYEALSPEDGPEFRARPIYRRKEAPGQAARLTPLRGRYRGGR